MNMGPYYKDVLSQRAVLEAGSICHHFISWGRASPPDSLIKFAFVDVSTGD